MYHYTQTWWDKEVRFPIKSVYVEGNRWLPADAVIAKTPLPIGQSMLGVDLKAIADAVDTHPWIEKAHVYRRLPSTVVVYIDEVEPLALIPGNPMGVIGCNGTYLGPVWHGSTWDLPLLAGVKSTKLRIGEPVHSEEYMAIINCALDISNKAPEVFRMISDFYQKGDHIYMTLEDGKSQVRVMKDAPDVNWNVLKEFMLKNRQDFADQRVQIDLRFPQWVIVSPIKG